MKHEYAQYMISWIDRIGPLNLEPFKSVYPVLKSYWLSSAEDFDEDEVKESLWAWIDANGGPVSTNRKDMAVARMVLCLAYKDIETMNELIDIGFFEDLLEQYGYSRAEINRHY